MTSEKPIEVDLKDAAHRRQHFRGHPISTALVAAHLHPVRDADGLAKLVLR